MTRISDLPFARARTRLDALEVWEVFRRRRGKLSAKSSKRQFGRPELDFLGHWPSRAGPPVDPRKCTV